MGFFKKIGKAIKKNVSFKNLVKIATPIMGAIPFVGGVAQNLSQSLQDAHQAKKDAKAQNDAQAQYNAEVQQQQAMAYAGQQAGSIANAGAQMFAKGVTEGAYAGVSTGVINGLGQAGAGLADSTMKAWFTKHWKHILIGLSGLGVIYLIMTKMGNNSGNNRARRRR